MGKIDSDLPFDAFEKHKGHELTVVDSCSLGHDRCRFQLYCRTCGMALIELEKGEKYIKVIPFTEEVEKAVLGAPDPVPDQIPDWAKANLTTLLKAADNGHIALLSAIHKDTGETHFLVTAMGWDKDKKEYLPSPLARMIDENPYEAYYDPTKTEPEPDEDNEKEDT